MATEEKNGLLTYKDKAGNKYLLYPITKAECVDGLDEAIGVVDQKLDAHVSDKNNPHGVTVEQIGAAPAYTYGTEDLVAGQSPLETGKLHFVYE